MNNIYRINRANLIQLMRHAKSVGAQDGREICGLIIGNGLYINLIELKNKTRRGGGFSFYSSEVKDIVKASRLLNIEILGTFHSHPIYMAKPGQDDIGGAVEDSLMLIIDCNSNKAILWRIKNGKSYKIRYLKY